MTHPHPALTLSGLHVAARRVLLDALVALDVHRHAVVVAGAQAVYLRSTDANLSVAAFTKDGDLAIDPAALGPEPRIEEAMRKAGFRIRERRPGVPDPGTWVRTVLVGGLSHEVPVDLIVPAAYAGSGGRAARIPPHHQGAASRAAGLEPALVDCDSMTISSLGDGIDDRRVEVRVAGTAALLIAKAYKIAERVDYGRPGRAQDKDGGDVVRLMMSSNPRHIAVTFRELLDNAEVGTVTRVGLAHLHRLFGGTRTIGVEMAVRALTGGMPETTVRALPAAYLADLPVP